MALNSEAWDDFGQKVDLTARLREILINYPEGTSILKELVQNAVRSGQHQPCRCVVNRANPPRGRAAPVALVREASESAAHVLPCARWRDAWRVTMAHTAMRDT